MTDISLTLAGEPVRLLPERALLIERTQTLLVADLHLGKAATFRAAGLPIPGEAATTDLARLSGALQRSGAHRLIVLGDLLHAAAGRSPELLALVADWRRQQSQIDITLVRGNHDRRAGDPPPAWQMECVSAPLAAGAFWLQHEPDRHAHGYVLAGHLHPVIRLQGRGQQRLRLPCFWFGAHVGVLPAFGGFTGGALVAARPGDQVFVLADGEVIALTKVSP